MAAGVEGVAAEGAQHACVQVQWGEERHAGGIEISSHDVVHVNNYYCVHLDVNHDY